MKGKQKLKVKMVIRRVRVIWERLLRMQEDDQFILIPFPYQNYIIIFLQSQSSLQITIILLQLIMSKQQYNKRFRQQEVIFNNQTVQRNKVHHISPVKDIRFNSEDSVEKVDNISLEKKNRIKNEQYSNLLKQQITLSRIEDEYLLNRSRKIDMQNASYLKDNYPFGFQGVKVCEGVIEKYKASNYTIQKNMLQKFEREAEEFRRNRIKRYKQQPVKIQQRYIPIKQTIQVKQQRREQIPMRHTQPVKQVDNISVLTVHINQKQRQSLKNLQALRRSERQQEKRRKRKDQQRKLRRQKKSDIYIKREKQNLMKVGNMLKQIDHKIKENSSKLSLDIQALRNHLKPNTPKKGEKVPQERLFKIVNKISQNSKSYSKIPVVMYNSSNISNKIYYDDTSHNLTTVNRKDFDSNSSTEINQLIHILRKNQNRLKLLVQTHPTQTQNNYGDLN